MKIILLIVLLIGVAVIVMFRVGNRSILTFENGARESDRSLSPDQTQQNQDVCNRFWFTRSKGRETQLTFVVKPAKLEGTTQADGELLFILDEAGKTIFEHRAVSFSKIWTGRVLGKERSQLVIENVNYGGSGRFFKVLDYTNNQVVDLTEDSDAMYDAFAEIVPQFHKGSDAIKEPFQILLTSPGLSNPIHYTTVLRYRNGKYVLVGQYIRNEAAAFTEKLMTK